MPVQKALVIHLFFVFICAGLAHAQLLRPAASQVEAIEKVAHWVGEWEGTGWALTGPDTRVDVSITQSVNRKISGSVLLMQGRWIGTGEQPRTDEAIAVLSYDPATEAYRLRTYDLQGLARDSDFRLTESGAKWGFDDHLSGGRLRFVMEIDDARWHETGEFSPDGGRNWFRILELTLARKGGTGTP